MERDERDAADGPDAAQGDRPAGTESAAGRGGTDDPAAMLGEVGRLRSQARAARHAYWFPLVLFGVLACASVPFYLQPPPTPGTHWMRAPTLPVLGGYFVNSGWRGLLAYYWLVAIAVGLGLTWLWYWRHGRSAGVVTPSRGYLITTAAIVFLALLPWILFRVSGGRLLPFLPGDLILRGTFPLVIIGLGLWVLARAERSWALLAIAAVYTGTALLVSLYDIENVLFRLGWTPTTYGWRFTALPNVLLPALVLLAAGAGAFAVQRRKQPAV
jgi:hypothetical protein